MPDANIIRRDHKVSFKRLTGSSHTFHLQPFKGFRLEVDDIHYNLDSAVFLPALGEANPAPGADPSVGLGAASESLLQIKKNPTRKALILGHADTSGDANYNVSLSVKRAKTAKAIILGERDEFVKTCQEKHKNEDIDHILKWVNALYGWDCAPVGQTRSQAIKKFQQRYNIEWEAKISEDGSMGPQTWGAFFDVYQDMLLNLVETDEAGMAVLREKFKAAMHPPGMAGCGENFPLPINDPVFGVELPRPAYGYRSQADRRTEILFFETGQEPKMDCHPGGEKCVAEVCEVYNTKMYRYTPIDVPDSKPRGNRVFLKMIYLDPEDKPKPFPKDFPVKVVYTDNTVQDEKVGDEGKLEFGAQRGRGEFTLKFDTPGPVYIAVSADEATNKLAKKADLAQLHKDKFRFFQVPKQWSLVESKWTVAENKFYKDDPDYKFFVPGRFGKTIGGSAAPVEMKLDPHWSFLRFEFADRHFCHSDHSHKRVNIPATLIGGWRTSPAGAGDPDTATHWTIKDTEVEKAVHAMPWIIQKKADNSADPRPDKSVQFEMKSDWLHASETPYVISKSATERVIETRADGHNDLKPSEKRLDFYDLPKVWKSDKYFTRFIDNTGEYFDKASTFEQKIKDSLKAPDKFLAFSLDDIVLVDQTFAFLNLGATDDPAIFFHQFKDPGVQFNGKSISAAGVYNVGANANPAAKPFFPYSDITMPVRHYIHDYPNWVRVVAAQGCLFDVFNVRTRATDAVAGARAAVRWLDTANALLGVPANGQLNPRPARTDQPATNPFFSIQPFFEMQTDWTRGAARPQGAVQEWQSPRAPAGGAWGVGRFDMVLLRDCDLEGGNEVVVNMHYFRFFLNFATANPPPAPFNQQNYRRDVTTRIPTRWNGPDGAFNATPPKILPDGNPAKLQGKVYWFVQDVPLGRQHYNISVQASTAPGASRAHMSAFDGTGGFNESTAVPAGDGTFVAAHECGHGDGLYDEYNELWSLGSYEQPSYATWMPGDPFQRDAFAMMNGNRDVKRRHYWHAAEWVRVATGINTKLDFGGDVYQLPRHPTPTPLRSYVLWPIWSDNQVQGAVSGIGGRRNFDVYLYPLGNEDYSRAILPGRDLRGLMLVEVKIEVSFDDPNVLVSTIYPRMRDLFAGVDAFFNQNVAMAVNNATIPGTAFNLSPCGVIFTPRFLVPTFPTNLGNNAQKAQLKRFFDLMSLQSGGAVQVCPAADPARTTYLTNTAPGLYAAEVQRIRNAHNSGHFRLNIRSTYANGWQGGGGSNRLRLTDANLPNDFPNFFGDMVGLDTSLSGLAMNVLKNRILRGIVQRALPSATVA